MYASLKSKNGGRSRIIACGGVLVTVIALVASLFTLTAAKSAYAEGSLSVAGADHYGSVSADSAIDILSLSGQGGETIYVDMWRGADKPSNYVAKRYPWTFSQSEADADGRVGIVSMKLSTLVNDYLSDDYENYHIAVYDKATAGKPLYEGTLHGVYASLQNEDGESEIRLLGTRLLAVNGSEDDRTYQAPATYYLTDDDGQSVLYALKSQEPIVDEGEALTFAYVPASDASLAGSVTYIDDAGNKLYVKDVAGITEGSPVAISVPSIITAKDPADPSVTNYYRTIFPAGGEVVLSYPNQLNYTIRCKSMGPQGDSSENGAYQAKINYVANGTGDIVMTDRVTVKQKTFYTIPDTFFQRMAEGSDNLVISYTRAADQDNVLVLDPADPAIDPSFDNETGRELVYTVYYDSTDPGSPITWTVVKIAAAAAASEDAGDGSFEPLRFGSESFTVEPGETAVFEAKSEVVGGQAYVPFGNTTRTFTHNGSTDPVEYVYYVPDGYTPEDSYQITVQYMNIADSSIIESSTIDVSPEMLDDIEIAPGPERLISDGRTFVRLAGQSDPYYHGYYTPYRTYTIYYRDINDDTYANTVITRTQVVTIQPAGGDDGPQVGLDAGAALATAGQDGAADAGVLYNEEGVDTQTEREIEDNENPLAAGPGANQLSGIFASPIGIAAIIGVLALLLAGLFFFWKKRKDQDDSTQSKAL